MMSDREDSAQRENETFSPEAPHFLHIVSMLTTQALVDLGQVPHPLRKDQKEVNLKGAKYAIDLLGILEEKTKGNLTSEEEKALSSSLSTLRLLFVEETRKQQP